MCLSDLWSDARREEWLKDKPEQIQAFKVVLVSGKRIYPLFGCLPSLAYFQKINDQTGHTPRLTTSYDHDEGFYRSYEAHFHLFPNREDAENFQHTYWGHSDYVVLECRIPKEHITAMGLECLYVAIIAKRFEFVEENHWFREPENAEVEADA